MLKDRHVCYYEEPLAPFVKVALSETEKINAR